MVFTNKQSMRNHSSWDLENKNNWSRENQLWAIRSTAFEEWICQAKNCLSWETDGCLRPQHSFNVLFSVLFNVLFSVLFSVLFNYFRHSAGWHRRWLLDKEYSTMKSFQKYQVLKNLWGERTIRCFQYLRGSSLAASQCFEFEEHSLLPRRNFGSFPSVCFSLAMVINCLSTERFPQELSTCGRCR